MLPLRGGLNEEFGTSHFEERLGEADGICAGGVHVLCRLDLPYGFHFLKCSECPSGNIAVSQDLDRLGTDSVEHLSSLSNRCNINI